MQRSYVLGNENTSPDAMAFEGNLESAYQIYTLNSQTRIFILILIKCQMNK